MEHLPVRTGNPRSVFPPIPYLCNDRYDGGPFLEYPRRLGLPNVEDVGSRVNPHLSTTNKQLLAALPPAYLQPFLQNWLFFGLLHEVLGDLFRYEDFVTRSPNDENGWTVITTAELISRLEEWGETVPQDEGPRMAVYEHIAHCLTLAYACLMVRCPAFDNDLKFHLASVAEIVGWAANKACNVAWTDSPRRSLIPLTWGRPIDEGFAKSILLDRSNCCRSQIQMLIEYFKSPQALAFVASCFQDDTDRSQHASCDETFCRAGNSVGPIPHHVSDSCKCQFIYVEEASLIECLRKKDCLPLLRLREDQDSGRIAVEVVESTKDTRYVALSHVWADGLGNPKATALPRCQLLRSKALIKELDRDVTRDWDRPESPSEMLLWCDTLCCPVDSPEGKKMALAKMYRTYDEASEVLVVDQGLISRRVEGMRPDEACLRIATSRWMTRLWTLQEGALPGRKNNLWFRFTNTALNMRTLYEHLHRIETTDVRRRAVAGGIIRRFHTFMALFDVTDAERLGATLQDIMRALMYRSVTISSDEAIITANFLALDLHASLGPGPTGHMQALWRCMSSSRFGIHKELLFQQGPRMKEPGFRWAPSSLLSIDRHFFFPFPDGQEDRGFLATRGLIVEFAGLRVSIANPAAGLPKQIAGFDSLPEKHPDRHNLLMRDHHGHWYTVFHCLYCHSDCPPDLEAMCTTVSRLCRPWILYRGSRSSFPQSGKAHRGLLIEEADEQESQGNEITCVESKSHIAFGHVPMEMNHICEAAYSLAQELDSTAAASHMREWESVSQDLANPAYRETLQAMGREIDRLSRSPIALEALAAGGNSIDERGITRISEHTERFYRGLYLHLEEYAPATRKWCVD